MSIHNPDWLCVHYWIIETPDGPTSKGYCKRCGVEGEFANVHRLNESNWDLRDKKDKHTESLTPLAQEPVQVFDV